MFDDGNDEVYCTNCRARISDHASYCTECGAEQAHVVKDDNQSQDQGEPLSLDEEYCSNCGEIIPAGVPFCSECGTQQGNNEIGRNEDREDSWIIGMEAGSTFRNLGVGLLYFVLYPIGIPLLMYGYIHGKREWSNQKIGIVLISVVVVMMAGLIAIGLTVDVPEQPAESNDSSSAPADSSTTPATEEKSTDKNGNTQSSDVAIRVGYSGEWSGATSILYEGGSKSRSISGTGTTTIPISGDPESISVNAQKQDGSSATLVVQIIEDGEVIAESSTNSAYGIAQTSSDINDFF